MPPKHVVDIPFNQEDVSEWHHPECKWRVEVKGADHTPGFKDFWHFLRYYEEEPSDKEASPDSDDRFTVKMSIDGVVHVVNNPYKF